MLSLKFFNPIRVSWILSGVLVSSGIALQQGSSYGLITLGVWFGWSTAWLCIGRGFGTKPNRYYDTWDYDGYN